MIRFRNPACDLHGMIKIFSAVYAYLKERETFGIHDMTQAIVGANLMSSSGYTGKKALELGANTDKRLDKTYNNSKMFSEWFRLLGWIASVSSSALEFRFTYLGIHAATAAGYPDALLEECLLGINNPNVALRVKYTEPVRFFRCLLRTMLRMDGKLCRDEMILGPMCADDRSEETFSAMIDNLQSIRGNRMALDAAFQTLCGTLHMKESSVRNCTRFPISALRYCGWAEEYQDHMTYSGSSIKFFALTEYGKQRAEELEQVTDLRLSDVIRQSTEVQEALIRQGFYQMMARAGFDIAAYGEQAEQDALLCGSILAGRPLYFSPYQTIDARQVDAALGVQQETAAEWPDLFVQTESSAPVTALPQIKPIPIQPLPVSFSAALHPEQWDDTARAIAETFSAQLETGKTPKEVAAAALERYQQANQTVFYPLVASLFQILGYCCTASRQGDNAERWDAIISDEEQSIPIEIKSPMEEKNLSMKAVRQALENKIVLLSRRTHVTTAACATLAVGFLPPNARADVTSLIADIKKTYGFSVAVIDFGSLAELVARTLQNKTAPEEWFVQRWEGIIHADHITTTDSARGDPAP